MSCDYVDFIFGGTSLCSPSRGVGSLCIKPRFAWVVGTLLASIVLHWLIRFMVWLKVQKILIPELEGRKTDVWKLWQRAGQVMVDRYMDFFILLFFGGLEMPVFASIAAAGWILLEIFYSDSDSKVAGIARAAFYLLRIGAVVKFGYNFSKL